jgi:hypothetical protein
MCKVALRRLPLHIFNPFLVQAPKHNAKIIMPRAKSAMNRPPSRYFTADNPWPTKENNRIQTLLNNINPRALTQHPPKGANAEFILILYNLIQITKQLETTMISADLHTQNIIHQQSKILNGIYDHLYFVHKRKWIPS